jgi:hypothetical protein
MGDDIKSTIKKGIDQVGAAVEDYTGLDVSDDSAVDRARRDQQAATDSSNDTQHYMYDTTRNDQEPWRDAGKGALSQIQGDPNFNRSFSMSDFQADPGYAFRMAEGQKALERSAAARGNLNSGATLKALTRYNQDLGSQEYQNAYNRFSNDQTNRFNRLASLAGLGQTATQATSTAGQNYANAFNTNTMLMGQNNADANIVQGVQRNKFIDQMIKAGSTAASGGTGGVTSSDIRLKTDIKPVSDSDLNELRSHLKAYTFKYLSESHGKGDWLGVMAQDLEQSKLGRELIEVDSNGHKMINNNKAISLMLAILSRDEANAN